MFKKILMVLLVSVLVFTSLGFENSKVNAEVNQSETFKKTIENIEEKTDVIKFEVESLNKDLKSVSLDNSIERSVTKEEDGTIIIKLIGKRETLNMKDEVEVIQVNDEIVIKSEKEIYINGERLPEKDLYAEFKAEPTITPSNSSGFSWLTRWSLNTRGDYNVRTYESADAFMDESRGGYRSKNVPYGTEFVDFRNLENQVTSARKTIVTNSGLLAAALGVTAISWASVIGAIGGGLAAAGFAIVIFNASSDGKSCMKQAYNLLGRI